MGNHQHEKEGDAYTPLTICQQFYHNGSISPASESFDIDAQVDEGDVNDAQVDEGDVNDAQVDEGDARVSR